MTITLSRLTTQQAKQIATWHYPPPYQQYSFPIEHQTETIAYLMDTETNAFALTHQTIGFIGFVTFGHDGQVPGGDYHEPALDFGIGLAPDQTGKGHGLACFNAITVFAQSSFSPPALRATVAAHNLRAQQVCQSAGFRLQSQFQRKLDQTPFFIFLLKL